MDQTAWMLSVGADEHRILVAGGTPAPAGMNGTGVLTVVRGANPPSSQRILSPRPGLLWWVHPLSCAVAWVAGENGTVLRYDESGATPDLRALSTPTSAVLYGIWAFSDDDVWAVGGDAGRVGVVLHGGRAGFSIDATPPATATLFKIYGADPDHLFIVGMGGTLLRREGGTWHLDPALTPLNETLLTVHGRGKDDVWAVGISGRVLHFDGQGWRLRNDMGLAGLNGVFVSPTDVLVSGQRGLLATSQDGGPFQMQASPSPLDLHGLFVFGEERFAAGGNLSQFGADPPQGVLLHQGPSLP